jgi:hypothetical protein
MRRIVTPDDFADAPACDAEAQLASHLAAWTAQAPSIDLEGLREEIARLEPRRRRAIAGYISVLAGGGPGSDRRTRPRAIVALKNVVRSAAPQLVLALRDPVHWTREGAAEALGYADRADLGPWLISLFEVPAFDPDDRPDCRTKQLSLVDAVVRLARGDAWVRPLIACLDGPADADAADALARIGGAAGALAFFERFETFHGYAASAVACLERPPPGLMEDMRRHLRSRDRDLAESAAEVLAHFGDGTAARIVERNQRRLDRL